MSPAQTTTWFPSCTSPPRDTPDVVFYDWLYSESYYDGANFAYSTDNGSTWTVLEPYTGGGVGRAYYGTLYSGERGWSGTMPWGMEWFRIPVGTGAAVKLRWKFTSDGSVQYDGGGYMFDEFAAIGLTKPANDVGAKRIIAPTGTIP